MAKFPCESVEPYDDFWETLTHQVLIVDCAPAETVLRNELVKSQDLTSSTRPQSQRHRVGSMGLGLYIAKEVVTAHGGTIDVKSSDSAGTVFTVRLPR